jgi:hypothetical protein
VFLCTQQMLQFKLNGIAFSQSVCRSFSKHLNTKIIYYIAILYVNIENIILLIQADARVTFLVKQAAKYSSYKSVVSSDKNFLMCLFQTGKQFTYTLKGFQRYVPFYTVKEQAQNAC